MQKTNSIALFVGIRSTELCRDSAFYKPDCHGATLACFSLLVSGFPVIPYAPRSIVQILLGHTVTDTLDHIVHDSDVVTLVFVIAKPREAPSLLRVHVDLHDTFV